MSGRDYNVSARLSLGDASVPISSFQFEVPDGVIGSKLTCDLADIFTSVDDSLDLLFEVGIGFAGGFEWTTMMDIGRINSLDSTIRWLGDGSKMTAVSNIADRWNFAPEAPILLYDPDIIDPLTTGQAGATGELVDENHNPIFPELVPKPSLDLQQLINFVYVDKLGFTRVITNIPNFRLNFVEIPLTASFHSAVSNEVSIFQPEYYTDEAGVLWIVDPQGVLPSGLIPRTMQLKHYASFQKTKQTGKTINAVILSYKDNFTTGPITSRVEQEVQEVGIPFSLGWQRTTISRFINDFHDNPRNLTEVTRSVVTRILTQVMAEYDNLARLISTEDQQDSFLYDFRLKTGYIKTLTRYFPIFLGDNAASHLVQVEQNQIVWENLTRSGEYIKRFEIISITGPVVKTFDDPDNPDTSPYRLQSLDQVSRLNRNDLPSSDSSVLVENQPIITRIDEFRNVARDQIEVASQRINYLSDPGRGVSDRGETFQHTGTIQARATTNTAMQTRMVIPDQTESNPTRRVPASLNAGNVPFDVAKILAQRILARHGNQPAKVNMELSGLDLALRRGSLRRVLDRDDVEHVVFITGFSIHGENLGRPDFRVTMTAQGIVI